MKKIYISFVALLFSVMVMAQNFTAGNLIVYRAGDGSAAVGNTGTAVFLDEYNVSTGVLVQSLAMPTTVSGANKRLVCVGNSTTEGFLTLSANKQYIVAPGYDAATTTASLGSSASATTARVIARVDATKAINTTTALTNAFSGAAFRGVSSSNGTDFWIAGGNTGTLYAPFGGTTSTTITTSPTNMRNTYVYDNQVYVSTGGGTGSRVQKVGTGLPILTGQLNTSLSGIITTGGSVNSFFFADLNTSVAGVDVLFMACDISATGFPIGLHKYITTDGTNWISKGVISTTAIRGLTAQVVGADITLYATTTINSIVKFTDVGALTSDISTGALTTLATGATNTLMKGICFAPELPTLPTLSVTPSSFSNIITPTGTASASQNFSISGLNLTGAPANISITPSVGLEVSTDNSSWSAGSINVSYTTATLATTNLYTRIAATAVAGTFTGTVTCAGGGATNVIVNVSGGVSQNFYSKATGVLSSFSTWGTSTDGSGIEPTTFNIPYTTFNVVNRTSTGIGGPTFGVFGTSTKLKIGDGTNPTTLISSASENLNDLTKVDVAVNSTLDIQTFTGPSVEILGAVGGTVIYSNNSSIDTTRINNGNYYHLILKDGLKYFKPSGLLVAGDLTFDNTFNSNGAASPFTTIFLKGNLNMINNAMMEDSTTGQGNRLTLSMAGVGSQVISTQGNELKIFRLIRDTLILNNLDITVASNSKITLGNNTSGGLNLLQRVGTTPTITRLLLNNNAQLAVVKAGTVFTDATRVGKIFSTNGKIIINKSFVPTVNAGTLLFENGSTLSELTLNISNVTKDTLNINGNVEIVNALNLTKGIIVLTPTTTLTLSGSAAVTGGGVTSYVDGKLRRLNPTASSFLFPVGQAKQYAPIEMSGLTATDNFTVQYFKQAYSNLTVSAASTAATPGYIVSSKEYWNIDRVGATNPNIKFYYNPTSLADASQAKIAHFNGADWDDIGRDSYGSDVNGNFIAQNMISTFSPFTFGGLPLALPIRLSSFTALKNDKTVKIQFSTALEANAKHFVIERSTDAKNWSNVITINANGNTNSNTSYSETDYNPTTGINFYRIKTVDNDGKIYFSAIKSVLFSNAFEVVVSPNPVKDIIQVLLSKKETETVSVIITNSVGVKVYEQRTNNSNLFINAASYAKGTYFVRVISAENIVTKAILIQ
jgi:Secretion system C-terminal sorting domain